MQKPSHLSSPHPPARRRQIWSSLQHYWQALSGFMVQKAQQTPALHPAQYRYSAKGRFYGYLPPSEEQRDWLEKIYHQPSSPQP